MNKYTINNPLLCRARQIVPFSEGLPESCSNLLKKYDSANPPKRVKQPPLAWTTH